MIAQAVLDEWQKKDPDVAAVLRAFDGVEPEMRTIGGIARETGQPVEAVESVLRDHPEMFEPAGLLGTSPVYRVASSLVVRQHSRSPVSISRTIRDAPK